MSLHWTYADGPHLIPVDTATEWAVAGLAIATDADAQEARDLAPLLYDARLAKIIRAAAAIGPEVRDGDAEWNEGTDLGFEILVQGCVKRMALIEQETGEPLALLRQLIAARPGIHYEHWLGVRLRDAHAARLQIASLIGQLDDLGVDVSILTEHDDRQRELSDHVLRVATVLGALIGSRASSADVVDAVIDLGVALGLQHDEVGVAIAASAADPSEES